MMNEVEDSSTNVNASTPTSMDSNSGKSTRSCNSREATLKRNSPGGVKARANLQ